MCRRYMCRRTVCVRGVVVKMLVIELHDRRGKLFVMLCLYVYSYSYRHFSHISYTYMNRHSYVCIISLVLFL